MAAPRQPETGNGSKSGQAPGEEPSTQRDKSEAGARPVDEEDVFGGAERAQNEDVQSENAKP